MFARVTDSCSRTHARPKLAQIVGISLAALPDEQLDSETIKRTCRAIPGGRKYAERWIDCRYRILERRRDYLGTGSDPTIVYPTPKQFSRVRNEFVEISRAFDKVLYKPGRRRTRKDTEYSSSHELARHNIINYHFIFHNLLLRAGCRRAVSAHFFFSLLSTERVLSHLHAMWTVLCEHLNWEVTPLSVLLDQTYDQDPAPVDPIDHRGFHRLG